MKRKFLDSSMQLLEKEGNYTSEQIEVILYGLEGIYLTITKMIIIFALAYVMHLEKEVILLLISYNIIRSQAFGLHASKSIYCLISSILLFIGGALLCKYLVLPTWFLISCSVLCCGCLFLYAPADTYKRPLVNERKRRRFKCVSVFLGIVYTVFIILLRGQVIANYLLFGMIEAVIMILPISYKVFRLPYDNYKSYYSGV